MSVVRDNLMNEKGYTPYCGNLDCTRGMPRTKFDGHQFKCNCGWRSDFERGFILNYKQKWGI